MASIEKLIEDYMDAAVGPEDMQQLALLQLANASVQDDAVGRAAQNLQGVEKANRSALENYMMAQDEMAQAEADKALQMAQQRLSSIDMNISQILMTPAGISKEGKSQLAQLRAEREAILKAFPQLGSAESVGGFSVNGSEGEGFDIGNDRDRWIEIMKRKDPKYWAKIIEENQGDVPEGFEKMLRFNLNNANELTDTIKTDQSLRSLLPYVRSTLGDAQDEAARKKKAEEKARKEKEEKKTLDDYLAEAKLADIANNTVAQGKYRTNEFKNKMRILTSKNLLEPEMINRLRNKYGDF